MFENEKYLLKMKQDMSLKNFTQSTSEDYCRFVLRFLNFTGKEAMSITYADIRRFIFHMKDEEHKKASTINCYTAAIRFFFEYTLGYVWDSKKIPKMKRDHRLPAVLTREQVQQLIDATENYKHKAIPAVIYSSGLRVSEACRLRYEDISRSKKTVYISKAKNRQDRYSILSDRCLEILTEYGFRYNRPCGWLFPGTVRDGGAVYEGTNPPAWVPAECDTTFTAAFVCRASAGRWRKPDHHPAAFRPPEPVIYKPLPPDDIQSADGHPKSV